MTLQEFRVNTGFWRVSAPETFAPSTCSSKRLANATAVAKQGLEETASTY
jgi:hypothetical protein